MTAETETDWASKIGSPAYGSIAGMVAALECDYDRLELLRVCKADGSLEDEADIEELAELEGAAGDCSDRDDAQTRIQEDALEVTIRGERRNGEWEADEFTILLTTGGPAVRIKGELSQHNEPSRAWLEVQDWFKPWTQYYPADQDVLLTYCREFCFE